MKKLFAFGALLLAATNAFAQACTAVCPAAIGLLLLIATKMGVKVEVVGVLSGALLSIVGYILIKIFNKRNWHFWMRDKILMAFAISLVGFVYLKDLTYQPMLHWHLLYIDSFLLATLCGAAAHICGVHLYAWMKEKNGGHAHFPFEKVVVPLLCDALMCYVFWGTNLCNCHEIVVLN